MPTTHLVVDGSNIATEGRSLPSLQQLLDAVDAITKEFEHANVTVIVDATFGHRIDASERPAYEEKINKGEIITPPAGVIGRGDAFILEVADRAGAIVLSNDSFQEFHGTYEWLFTEGRLLGGKHVPGVGWIFLARSPVRGPTSRRAVSDAKRKRRGSKKAAAAAKPASKRPSSKAKAATPAKGKAAKAKAVKADEPAGRKRGGKEPEPYNEPLPFIEFVGAHPVGSIIEAEVEQFASHGAYVICDGTRCYISLKSISDPPPRSAREVLTIGETRQFVVKAIDTPRRGIDLVMPGMEGVEEESRAPAAVEEPAPAAVSESKAPAAVEITEPTEAPVPQELEPVGDAGERKLSVSQRRKLRAQQAAEAAAEAERPQEATVKKSPAKKSATKKKATAKKATAKKAAAKKVTAKKAATTKAAAKKGTAKKATAKKATAKKAATKKAAAKKSPAKKAATKKKAAAKKATAKKAPAKRASS
ncbi:MAG TPA: histone H1-like repetitive region-containing protein [Acidimicrobiales bacterium]|nr:histone H1-like repetitive region-containing protein [Acidimicrobiales bacterium]